MGAQGQEGQDGWGSVHSHLGANIDQQEWPAWGPARSRCLLKSPSIRWTLLLDEAEALGGWAGEA